MRFRTAIKDSSKCGFSRQDAKTAKESPKVFKSFSLRFGVILLAFNYKKTGGIGACFEDLIGILSEQNSFTGFLKKWNFIRGLFPFASQFFV
jgi:hypothetical protein